MKFIIASIWFMLSGVRYNDDECLCILSGGYHHLLNFAMEKPGCLLIDLQFPG